MKTCTFFMFALLAAGSGIACADTVLMRDGTTREGVVVSRTAEEVQLRMGNQGMQATVTIPMADVSKIIASAPAPNPPPAAPPSAVPKAVEEVGKTAPAADLPRRGFLVELAATAMGHGPDDPARLPDNLRNLWESALRRDALGNKADTLEALRALDSAFSPLKDGMARLDGVCRRERNGQSFGEWLAQAHWDVMATKFLGGQFDLKDVRDVERKPLIGILREKTAPALEPLKSYFPPIDEKTGKPQPFRPAQLSSIGVSNALEVKRQASFAGAVLLAQIKLEPQMPVVDRMLLASELQTVQRIMSRASDAEPAARAAAEKAEREKRIAEEKARHGG